MNGVVVPPALEGLSDFQNTIRAIEKIHNDHPEVFADSEASEAYKALMLRLMLLAVRERRAMDESAVAVWGDDGDWLAHIIRGRDGRAA
jgi:hypothetical protein